MAKNRQFLINHHTSGLDNMPLSGDVRLGEIIVRHNDTKPEILTLKDNGEFATFIDKGAVSGMIATVETKLEGNIDAVDAKFADYAKSANTVAAIEAVDGKVEALDNNLEANYAKSADTVAAIEASKRRTVMHRHRHRARPHDKGVRQAHTLLLKKRHLPLLYQTFFVLPSLSYPKRAARGAAH